MSSAVRRIEPHEGPLLSATRLAALADSPRAFARTYAEDAALAPGEWADRAAGSASGSDRATFLLVDDATSTPGREAAGGMVIGLRSGGDVELVSMWVAPATRGTGSGRRLVDAVIAWAAASGGDRVVLSVRRDNPAAQALYRRAGFVDVDEPIDGPCRDELRMARPVDPAGTTA